VAGSGGSVAVPLGVGSAEVAREGEESGGDGATDGWLSTGLEHAATRVATTMSTPVFIRSR
jgi:hypothetical protein